MSQLVVSDSSPLRCLWALSLLHLLPRLFDRILIPPAVGRELAMPLSTLPAIPLEQVDWLEVVAPKDGPVLSMLRSLLDPGEAEALALAIEVGADRLLIDERTGRAIAAEMHVAVTGVAGILMVARDAGMIPSAGAALRTLRDQHRFWVSDKVLSLVEASDPKQS